MKDDRTNGDEQTGTGNNREQPNNRGQNNREQPGNNRGQSPLFGLLLWSPMFLAVSGLRRHHTELSFPHLRTARSSSCSPSRRTHTSSATLPTTILPTCAPLSTSFLRFSVLHSALCALHFSRLDLSAKRPPQWYVPLGGLLRPGRKIVKIHKEFSRVRCHCLAKSPRAGKTFSHHPTMTCSCESVDARNRTSLYTLP